MMNALERVTLRLQLGGPRCVSAAGCEIPDHTPHLNLKAQNAALRSIANSATAT